MHTVATCSSRQSTPLLWLVYVRSIGRCRTHKHTQTHTELVAGVSGRLPRGAEKMRCCCRRTRGLARQRTRASPRTANQLRVYARMRSDDLFFPCCGARAELRGRSSLLRFSIDDASEPRDTRHCTCVRMCVCRAVQKAGTPRWNRPTQTHCIW